MGFLVHHGRYESAEQAALPKVCADVCVLRGVCVSGLFGASWSL